jgi:hypothetical protein
MLKGVLVLALALPLAGCGALGNKDLDVPGTSLGSYHVVGHLTDSTCGPGALGSTSLWDFDVKLSRDGNVLYWLNGQDAIPGEIATDGTSFGFQTTVTVQAQAAGQGQAGCSVTRTDSAQGELDVEGQTDVPAFTGTLDFGYAADAAADCSSLVGVQGGLATLPCDMSYSLSAQRTSGPGS